MLWRCHVDENGCWLFAGALDDGGYGVVRYHGTNVRIHQVTYEVLVEPMPKGMVIDHRCRVRSCCNPDHLEAVTNLENSHVRAYWPNGLSRLNFCSHGHPWTPENTYHRPDNNGRQCRTCIKQRTEQAAVRRQVKKKSAPRVDTFTED